MSENDVDIHESWGAVATLNGFKNMFETPDGKPHNPLPTYCLERFYDRGFAQDPLKAIVPVQSIGGSGRESLTVVICFRVEQFGNPRKTRIQPRHRENNRHRPT